MPGGHERFTKYDRLPHFCSRCDCLYQMNEKNCKREFENCVDYWFGAVSLPEVNLVEFS